MTEEQNVFRKIESERPFSVRRFFLRWEWLLVLLLFAVNIINILASSHYADWNNILDALRGQLDKAILVFPMVLVILLGEIDISVASTMALSAVIMGLVYSAGVPMAASVAIALVIGAICGFINGYILVKFKELSSMIVTLSTQIIYRGIANILLKTQSVGGFPDWFSTFAWGKVVGVPIILIFTVVEALVFAYILHLTPFGRRTYALGSSETVSRFSGIKTDRIKLIIFTVTGIMAAVAAIFLSSKMGSVRPDIARGYELDVIAMVVLGGVSTAGGKGNILGPVLAVLIISLLRYGLGLVNVTSQVVMIITGGLLIVSAAAGNIKMIKKKK